ncbi:hypothetical protein AMTR_s00008p00226600 [Amborella trichopoda]|uniref:Uncharacterized protein n=1 Tax=Amborella trichopoda TaxID=13333 RepID=W1NJP2_AMBTC|nr:hypothetical protein AMTR_s00008p00226600 [Amborella trichopoda]
MTLAALALPPPGFLVTFGAYRGALFLMPFGMELAPLGMVQDLCSSLELIGGLESRASWNGAGIIRNSAKFLSFPTALFVTEVSLVLCHRTFGRALAPVEETSESFLLNAS